MAADVHAKIGDIVLVKEAESVLANEGVNSKLAHEHSTGPWKVMGIFQP